MLEGIDVNVVGHVADVTLYIRIRIPGITCIRTIS